MKTVLNRHAHIMIHLDSCYTISRDDTSACYKPIESVNIYFFIHISKHCEESIFIYQIVS